MKIMTQRMMKKTVTALLTASALVSFAVVQSASAAPVKTAQGARNPRPVVLGGGKRDKELLLHGTSKSIHNSGQG